MKFLIIILSLTFVKKGCHSSKVNQDDICIEYFASARNSYQHIKLTNKTISKSNSRKDKFVIKPCSEENWTIIISNFKELDVKTISDLKSPSQKFLFDGAPIARLKITYQDSIYETQPFDHGNPHKDLKELVNKILTISKNIE